jgi:hypothetical protein
MIGDSSPGRGWEFCIATGCGLDKRGSRVRFPARAVNFSLHHRVQNGSGAHPQPIIQWVPGNLSPGVKRPVCQADHLPPTSAEIKNAWSYTPLPHTSSWLGAKLRTGTTLPLPLPPLPDRLWGPPSLSNGYQGTFSLGIKRSGREAGHKSPSSAKDKNTWSYEGVSKSSRTESIKK